MAAAAILNLLPVAIFNIIMYFILLVSTTKYLQSVLNYNFLKFKMAAFRHFGIIASSYWTTLEVSSLSHMSSLCQILC